MLIKEIFVFLGLVVLSHQKAVKVTVYYESLCPASMEFVTQQLYPTWKQLGLKYMKIDFVPYGKAVCIKDMPANVSHAIASCFNGVQGDQILAQYGDITHAALPAIRLVPNTGHVPQIEFNKVYNKDDEEQAFQDLKSVICKKVAKKDRPGCIKKARLNVL